MRRRLTFERTLRIFLSKKMNIALTDDLASEAVKYGSSKTKKGLNEEALRTLKRGT